MLMLSLESCATSQSAPLKPPQPLQDSRNLVLEVLNESGLTGGFELYAWLRDYALDADDCDESTLWMKTAVPVVRVIALPEVLPDVPVAPAMLRADLTIVPSSELPHVVVLATIEIVGVDSRTASAYVFQGADEGVVSAETWFHVRHEATGWHAEVAHEGSAHSLR